MRLLGSLHTGQNCTNPKLSIISNLFGLDIICTFVVLYDLYDDITFKMKLRIVLDYFQKLKSTISTTVHDSLASIHLQIEAA